MAAYLAALGLLFSGTLRELGACARKDLYSHLPLIPAISAWLIYRRRGQVFSLRQPAAGLSVALLLGGAAAGVAALAGARSAADPAAFLSLKVFSLVTLLLAGVTWIFGATVWRTAAFPLGFLYFLLPLPARWHEAAVTLLQRMTAPAAQALFLLTGTPVFREGQLLCVPGLNLQVAAECSGIHSTLVLAITALLAGHLLLRRWWSRALLAAVTIPLGVLRNALRIVAIALLTIHVDPAIIHGPLHRRGGPVFFVLSLALLLAMLLGLRKLEQRAVERRAAAPSGAGPAAGQGGGV